ncbi:MAG: hypothetical protein FWD29_03245 [Micrococcales bacterium]|nr:hypothetical protein [Micrococcales bacterium]
MTNPNWQRGARVLGAAVVAGLILTGLAALPPAQAAMPVPFAQRFQVNANGAIATFGNALMTCQASTACTTAQNSTTANNNDLVMVNLDADSDPTTFNSSASHLELPAGSSVLWAGLYWGARLTAGTSGSAGAGDRTQMLLKVPGANSYQAIASIQEFGPDTTQSGAYQQFADVTTLVQGAGGGNYWGANVVTGTGKDRYAGWTITVAYSAPGMPLRNLTVFDGFQVVQNNKSVSVTVAGFLAPTSPPVTAGLTMMVYEGDAGITGDNVTLNGAQLATAVSPGSNFFNSTADDNGKAVTSRTPAHRNMLGFDIKTLATSNILTPGDGVSPGRATFSFNTSSDVYLPGMVALAVDLYAPDFSASAKTVVNLNGNDPARSGDTLEYHVSVVNSGQDNAVNAVISDALPAGVTYVNDSMELITQVVGGTSVVAPKLLTDGVDADEGHFDAGANRVVINLGEGATSAKGGEIPIGQQASFRFRVTLDGPRAVATTVTNQADLAYTAKVAQVSSNYSTPPVSVTLAAEADVQLTKTMSPNPVSAGQPVLTTLTVFNAGPATALGVAVTDAMPASVTVAGIAVSNSSSCALPPAPGQPFTCQVGDLADAEKVTITVTGTAAANLAPGQLVNVASAAASTPDPDLSNNTAAATTTTGTSADLAITKSTSNPTPRPGEIVSFTITATNHGPSDAAGLIISDLVTSSAYLRLVAVEPGTSGATCNPGPILSQCALAALPVGLTVSLEVTGWVSPSAPAGTSLSNAASVIATTPDPATQNNLTSIGLTVAPPEADLSITKTGPASALPGGTISYTLSVTNHGPADSTGARVRDTLPAGLTAISASSTLGSCSIAGATVSCDLGAMAGPAAPNLPGQAPDPSSLATATITIEAQIDPALTGSLANTAQVEGPEDPDDSNNTWSIDTPLDPEADPVASQADVEVSALTLDNPGGADAYGGPGSQRIQTFIVTNNGPSVAKAVQFTAQIAVRSSVELAQLVGTMPTCNLRDTQITCLVDNGLDDTSDLQVGQSVTVTIRWTLASTATPGDYLANGPVGSGYGANVTVATTTTETDLSNNYQAVDLVIDRAQTDLLLTKTALTTTTNSDADPAFVAGSAFTYQLTAQVLPGAAQAQNVELTDFMPKGFTVTAVGTNLGTCAIAADGSGFSCQLGTMEGASADQAPVAQITVSGLVDPANYSSGQPGEVQYTNTAQLTSATDGIGTNPLAAFSTTARATVDVVRQTNLSITKVANDTEFLAGGQASWTVTVVNAGPSDLPAGATVEDTLQSGLVFDAAGSDPACAAGGQVVTCAPLPAIPAGQAVSVQIAAYVPVDALTGDLVPSGHGGPLPIMDQVTNQATVSAPSLPAAVTSPPVTTPIAAQVDTAITGSVSQLVVPAGSAISYTITGVNNGPSAARNPLSGASFPPEFVIDSVAVPADLIECAPSSAPGSEIGCSTIASGFGGPIAVAGITATGVVQVTIPPDTPPGVYTTVAHNIISTADGNPVDSNPNNDTVSIEVLVIPVADLEVQKTTVTNPVVAGQPVTYGLAVTNFGPSDTTAAQLTDQVPAGTTFVAAKYQGGGAVPCATSPTREDQPSITCQLGDMALGDTETVLLTFSTPKNLSGPLANTALVGSAAQDPVAANNQAAVANPVQTPPPITGPGTGNSGTPGAAGPNGPGGAGPAGRLPWTGADTLNLLVWALLAITGGLALRRLRRHASASPRYLAKHLAT